MLSCGFGKQAFYDSHVAWLRLHLFNSEIIAQSSLTQHLHQLVWLCSHTTLTKAGWRQAGRWRPAFVEKEGMLQIQRKNLQTQCSCPENSLGIKGSNKNVLLKSPAQTPSVDRGILSPYYPGLITPLFWGVSQALKDAYQHLWSLLSRYQ